MVTMPTEPTMATRSEEGGAAAAEAAGGAAADDEEEGVTPIPPKMSASASAFEGPLAEASVNVIDKMIVNQEV